MEVIQSSSVKLTLDTVEGARHIVRDALAVTNINVSGRQVIWSLMQQNLPH